MMNKGFVPVILKVVPVIMIATLMLCGSVLAADDRHDVMFDKAVKAYDRHEYDTAFALFLPLAQSGHAESQNNLGVMYETGQGVGLNHRRAFYWYVKAAQQGRAYAQNNLGVMYETGQGVAQDYHKAKSWYLKAAAAGNSQAQYNLGLIYEHGKGVVPNQQEAISWYQKAVESAQKDL